MGIQNSVNQMLGSIAGGVFAIKSTLKNNLQKRQNEALKTAALRKDAQKTQRRNFKEYVSGLKTQYGKLGDLGERTVELVAKQYTPYQRQKLMNTIDKEKSKK